ncbi:MAG: hypothetical protein RH949_00890 [Coleofasciculus sp. A1-SPW-01]|uniref:hypothetical protein n=1 Tax=Coleofasciculus sp. A1-SPW-01 TaxID=3070819 RepID=UPI0032F6BF9E
MTETKPLDEIIQRLDALSLEQLLEARTKIDALIESKYLFKSKDISEDIIILAACRDVSVKTYKRTTPQALIFNQSLFNDSLGSIHQSSSPKTEDDSLKDVIELVNGWMADESGYDEETYPQIEAGLNHNRLSL